jgi:hypothetical protein
MKKFKDSFLLVYGKINTSLALISNIIKAENYFPLCPFYIL